MNDTLSSNNSGSNEARVTQAGEAIGEEAQGATAAAAAVAGHAQKIVQDATAATAAAASQAKKRLGAAGEVAEQAWSQASTAAKGVVDASCRTTRSLSQPIRENPLMAVLVGAVLGYIAGWWFHGGGGRPRTPAAD